MAGWDLSFLGHIGNWLAGPGAPFSNAPTLTVCESAECVWLQAERGFFPYSCTAVQCTNLLLSNQLARVRVSVSCVSVCVCSPVPKTLARGFFRKLLISNGEELFSLNSQHAHVGVTGDSALSPLMESWSCTCCFFPLSAMRNMACAILARNRTMPPPGERCLAASPPIAPPSRHQARDTNRDCRATASLQMMHR